MRDIEKDLELCEKATEGPWIWAHERHKAGHSLSIIVEAVRANEVNLLRTDKKEDAQFIAQSREALPWYIEEVKRLREALGSEEVANWAIEAVMCRRETADVNIEKIRLDKENKELRAENGRLKYKLDTLADQYKNDVETLKHQNKLLNQALHNANETEEYYAWMPGEENNLDTLAENVPVRISSTWLKELIGEARERVEAENQLLRAKLNEINNNLATAWQEIEVGPEATWDTIDKIYKLSVLEPKA